MKGPLGVALLATTLAIGTAHASPYSAIYSFGDSLSDVGNVYTLTGGAIPISPYYMGRFSNGPNWLDDLSAKLGFAMSPSFLGGNDFAFGGAQTGPTSVNSGLPTDLLGQVAAFGPTSHMSGALYTLDIGANDIGNALAAYAADQAMGKTFDLGAFLTDAETNTVDAIHDLYNDGARSLLYFEVPDLSVVPAFESAGPLAGALAMEFNDGVLSGVTKLGLTGLTVFDMPVFSAIEDLVNYPEKYGLENVTGPCFSGDFDTPGTTCANPPQYLFWDTEHPTAAGNALTASLAEAVLTGAPDPIVAPEPSTWVMMLIGFAGLGYAGSRARGVAAARVV
jgi:outer membrane lipase/esterase